MVNETHDPAARSWVASANQSGADFPIQNLPLGAFRRTAAEQPRAGMAIGDRVLDLESCGAWDGPLHALMASPATQRAALRLAVFRLLRDDATPSTRARVEQALLPLDAVTMVMPAPIGDFTDFFGSIHHASRAVELMRPGAPLFESYRSMPLAYHGRSSSIVVSGTDVRRPRGQRRRREGGAAYEPTRRLDYEAELGIFAGPGNDLGSPIAIGDAWAHVVGVCLLNDWSARDIQAWESDPLGPFLGKSFATTVSPWVVTAEALAPYRVAAAPRGDDAPPLPDYLCSADDAALGAMAIEVEVAILTSAMRTAGDAPHRLSLSNAATLYWTSAQLVTHQTSNGCNLRPGDLLGSGTLSGIDRTTWACLLELTRGGREPITLPSGESRAFLEDGDEIVIRGRASAPGAPGLGLGECRGRVVAA
jgi:fumarylacetoacetase